MGNCCCHRHNERAFPSEINAPLVRDVMSTLPDSAVIVIVKVQRASELQVFMSLSVIVPFL